MRAVTIATALLAVSMPAWLGGCATPDAPADAGGGGADDGGGGTPEGGAGGAVASCAETCAQIAAPACFRSVCDVATGGCQVLPDDGAACDDGLFCTKDDVCQDGACAGAPNDCGLGGECRNVSCNESTRTCTVDLHPDFTPCPTTDLCFPLAFCDAGTCAKLAKDCSFAPLPDACHTATCNGTNGECELVPSNEGGPCPNDGDPCFIDKTCTAGSCGGGVPKDCSSVSDGCNTASCDATTGACVATPLPSGTPCVEATDACNAGACDAAGSCVPMAVNPGAPCDDGAACTTGDTCAAGACRGESSSSYVFFSETFASGAAGWTLEEPWDMGPAVASPIDPIQAFCSSTADPDPALDHTASADNGVAGVVIGGTHGSIAHPLRYLTSPQIDLAAAAAPVLSYWRRVMHHLNTVATVEVYDGFSWVTIWTAAGTQDCAQYTFVEHDISGFISSEFRVRFGVFVPFSGSWPAPGWTLDDVVISEGSCQ
jgi:hypothetical protein